MSVRQPKSPRNGRPKPPRGVAFYNLEGTLTSLTLTHAVLFVLGNLGELHRRVVSLLSLAARFPGLYLASDPKLLSRGLYESLKGVSSDRLAEIGLEYCDRIVSKHLYPAAIELLEANRKAGLDPVLVTALPDVIAAPLCRHLGIADFAASRMIISRGRATGRLAPSMIPAEQRAAWCADYVQRHGLDARACWAYANSYSDLPVLAGFGHPVAVNPDRKLHATAMNRQWPILTFEKSIDNESNDVPDTDIIALSGRPADGAS